jgi:Flp pilus assembly protein TadG
MPAMQSIMHRLIGRFCAVGKDRRASAAVELALAMPALCLFIFGIIEVGYALWMQNALDYSVAGAARCASLNGNACTGKLLDGTYAASLSGATIPASHFS